MLITIGYRLVLLLAVASTPASAFRAGEVLDYEVRYLRFMRGTARLVVVEQTTYQGNKAFRLTQDVNVGSLFSNHVESYCRQSDLFPLLITTRMKRKGKEAFGRQVYIPDQHTATFSLTEGGRTKSSRFQRKNPVQDVVTIMYYLRVQTLEQGASFPVSLKEGEYTLMIVGKENPGKVPWSAHPGDCWVLKSVPPKIKAWLTTDERHLPVKVEVEGAGGMKLLLKAVR